MASILNINNLLLNVRLGVPEAERAQPQPVSLTLTLEFTLPLSAEQTDRIDDTVCYDTLCAKITEFAQSREFKLVEHLARRIAEVVKNNVPGHINVTAAVHKLNPPIANLKGGVVYTVTA